jgi:hypothetical protein
MEDGLATGPPLWVVTVSRTMFLSIASSRTFSPIVELLLMHLLELHNLGTYTQAEPAELFGVGRSTIYRTLHRMRPASPEPEAPSRTYRPGSRHTQD